MPNNKSWYWPDVSGLDGAKSACRAGMWCAIIVAGITGLFAFLAIAGVKSLPVDGSALFDAALFGGIAFGLSRRSRFAGVAGFALFLIDWKAIERPAERRRHRHCRDEGHGDNHRK